MKTMLYVQHIYGNMVGLARDCSDRRCSDTQKEKQF